MQNNLNNIIRYLNFTDSNDFYIIEIIKRRKENPDMSTGSRTIKIFYVTSLDELWNLEPTIINFCEANNARAYIRLNKRNYKDLSLKIMNRSLTYVMNGNYKAMENVFHKVASKYHSDKDKKWIVDIDDDFIDSNPDSGIIKTKLRELQESVGNVPLLGTNHTPNGVHIITRPFHLKLFEGWYPDIDVHKDSPTLLYFPEQ